MRRDVENPVDDVEEEIKLFPTRSRLATPADPILGLLKYGRTSQVALSLVVVRLWLLSDSNGLSVNSGHGGVR